MPDIDSLRQLTFDTETVFNKRQSTRLVSFAHQMNDAKPSSMFFEIGSFNGVNYEENPAAFKSSLPYSSQKYFSKSGYERRPQSARYVSLSDKSKALLDVFVDQDGKRTFDVLSGYNVKYDIRQVLNELNERDLPKFLNTFDIQYKGGPGEDYLGQIMKGSKGNVGLSYLQYQRGRLSGDIKRSTPFVSDVLTTVQESLRAAESLGLADYGGDYFTGTKLSFVKNYFEANTPGAHEAAADVSSTYKLANQHLMQDIVPELLGERQMSDKTTNFLNYFGDVQKHYKGRARFEKLSGFAMDKLYDNKFVLDNRSFDTFDDFYEHITKRGNMPFKTLEGMSREQIEKNINRQINFFGKKFAGDRAGAEKFVSDFMDEETILKRITEKRNRLQSVLSASKETTEEAGALTKMSPGGKKGLLIAGGVVGLWALTNIISGKDDTYNTIRGMHEQGMAANLRHENTDFGSGYRGPVSSTISPEYNEAQDVPRLEMMRASKIGLSEQELYQYMTQPDKGVSGYVMASADAGTALHQLMQARRHAQDPRYQSEILVYNKEAKISGHIDEKTDMGIGDIKTVSNAMYKTIVKSGKPKPMHYSQVQFYLGTTGEEAGYIEYMNRDNPKQSKRYQFNFNPYYYESMMRKVDRARRRAEADVESGKISKSRLPMTASFERLAKEAQESETPAEKAANIHEYAQIYDQQMQALRQEKRGMPTQGKGYDRIQERNKRKRQQMMQSTQGLGLQIFNNSIQHTTM